MYFCKIIHIVNVLLYMTKKLFFFAVMLSFSVGVMAQSGKYLFLGYSPNGEMLFESYDQSLSNFCSYDRGDSKSYKIALGVNNNFLSFFHEITFSTVDNMFKEVLTEDTNMHYYDFDASYSAKMYSYTLFYGFTLGAERRIQVPLFLGFGVAYNTAPRGVDNIKSNFFISFDLAARLNIYITNRIALCGGYSLKWGLKAEGEKTPYVHNSYSDLGLAYCF